MRILLLIAALAAQHLPFAVSTSSGGRTNTGVFGVAPSYVYDIDAVTPIQPFVELSPGQGYINPEGNCVIRLALGGGNDYVFPPAMNRTNRWLFSLSSGGGRHLQWIGPETVTATSCSASAGTPGPPPGYPSDMGNENMFWSVSEDYVAYGWGGTKGPGSTQKLYEMRCTANCTLEIATWTWTVLKNFTGNDGGGVPFLDWDNKTFCQSGTPPGCTKVADYTAVFLWLSAVSPDSDGFLFSLRGGSKSEYGACLWRRSTDFFGCRYLDVRGQLPASATPLFPGTSRKGNGVNGPWNFLAANVMAYQINGSEGGEGAVSAPRWYRKPLPTARVEDWENAQSVSGTWTVGHGAIMSGGIATSGSAPYSWGTYRVFPFGENNYMQGYRAYSDFAATISDPDVGVPSRWVAYWSWDMYRDGFHISSSPRPDRQKWHLATFYSENSINLHNRSSRGSFYGELVLLDTTGPDLGSVDPTGVIPFPKGAAIRVGQHFSWCPPCSPNYQKQGQANISIDGSRAMYKSNGENGAGGSRDSSKQHSLYLMIFGSHVTWN